MKKNDWKSEDIWVNYCFLPDNVVSLPNRNLRSKTLNVGSTTLNGGSTDDSAVSVPRVAL